jgi:hypothetical protein
MLLTAEKIVLRDPKTRVAYYTVEVGLNDNVKITSAEDYRAAAERSICSAEAARFAYCNWNRRYIRVKSQLISLVNPVGAWNQTDC